MTNSAYTDLPQSLACKEMGAAQNKFPQMGWIYSDDGPEFASLVRVKGFIKGGPYLDCDDRCFWPGVDKRVAALPFYTDDPNEQSVVGLLEQLGFIIEYKIGSGQSYWRAERPKLERWAPKSTSLGALLMACYEKWKEQQPAHAQA